MKTVFPKLRVLLLIFSVITLSANAQDIIFKKTREEIKAKVLEVGLDEIKYRPFDYPDGPVISISKDDIWKIKFEKGSEWLNAPDPYSVSSAMEVRDKNRAIKFEFFSPLFGKLTFDYEQMIKVGMNVEFKLGIIGPSISNEISRGNPRGVFLKFGPKFLLGSEYVVRGMKYTHQLVGKYFKPEIILCTFNQDYPSSSGYYPYTSTIDRNTVTSLAINLVYGKQSIVGNAMTLDWYFGVGYGTQSFSKKSVSTGYSVDGQNYESYCFSHIYGGPQMPLIYTAGLAIGILVK